MSDSMKFYIEEPLPEIIDVSLDRFFVVTGWITSESKITNIDLKLGSDVFTASNIRILRPKVFKYSKNNKTKHSLFSGFRIPVYIKSSERKYTLDQQLIVNFHNNKNNILLLHDVVLNPHKASELKVPKHVNSKNLIVVCMPINNPSRNELSNQIESLINQEYSNWICLITDDGENNNQGYINNLISNDRRFFYYKNPEKLGLYKNLENCLSRAPSEAELVSVYSQGDKWHSGALSRLVEELREPYKLVYSNMQIVDEMHMVVSDSLWMNSRIDFNNYEAKYLLFMNEVIASVFLFDSELLKTILPFPGMDGNESDYKTWIALNAGLSGGIKYVSEPLIDISRSKAFSIIQDEFKFESRSEFIKKLLKEKTSLYSLAYKYLNMVESLIKNLEIRFPHLEFDLSVKNILSISGLLRIHYFVQKRKIPTANIELALIMQIIIYKTLSSIPILEKLTLIISREYLSLKESKFVGNINSLFRRTLNASVYKKILLSMYSTHDSISNVRHEDNYSITLAEKDIKFIAFYLPQFHPIKENDIWWGKGFTEWRNVTRALPIFEGHHQPRFPGELGYYDLRNPDVIERQIELAKNFGIYGFCFHYYWFNGKRLLERPLDTFLKNCKFNFPFCICWANENWSRRWDGSENEVLISQTHSEESDYQIIADLIPLFKDQRYIKVNDRPLLVIYRADIFPNFKETINRWQKYCKEKDIPEPYVIGAITFEINDPTFYGCDAGVEFPPHSIIKDEITQKINVLSKEFNGKIFNAEGIIRRKDYLKETPYTKYRCVFPMWDNSARKPRNAYIFHNSTPEFFKEWIYDVSLYTMKNMHSDRQFVFINAWNEWAEGAYLEPDLKYGYQFLQAISDTIVKLRELKLSN